MSDGRFVALLKIIRWQGTLIVLLFVTVILVAVVNLKDIKLPSQEPIKTPPPLIEKGIQYNVFAYQDSKLIRDGSIVTSTDLSVMGQVHDYKEAIKKWPDLSFIFNGAVMKLDQTGNYIVNLTLKPGQNIFETEINIAGQRYSRQQMTITYNGMSPASP